MIDRPVEIICEIGINHNGDMTLAAEMIKVAKDCGADTAKFQLYIPSRLLDKEHPVIKPWWDVILKTELTKCNLYDLKHLCDAAEIGFLCSVFHPDRVPWLEEVGVERYKIASRSLYNEELAAAIKETEKPVIRSWGYWDGRDPQTLLWGECVELYCVSEYPTPLENLHLPYAFLPHGLGWGDKYNGFSDHTVGTTAAIVAMARGARIIEKHFTLDKSLPGPDHVCSATSDELRRICEMRDEIEVILYG